MSGLLAIPGEVEVIDYAEAVATMARRRIAAALAESRGPKPDPAAQAWRDVSPELRMVVLSMCTDRRDVDAAALMSWGQLTADERIAIGATLRQWRRELERAAWLR